MSHRCWTLSPSDFALLWEDCRRCFYLEIVSGFRRPRPAMPKIFTVIDERMKAALEGRRTEAVCPEMPPGVFEYGERRVESTPIDVHLPDRVARCAVRGKLDVVARLDDG
ncbi:MAG TPA: hypothetical protein VFX28_09995, partial [Methylomirabilota bacterium]|nr:hypothetical protein [Methylomirabilota bacterium]